MYIFCTNFQPIIRFAQRSYFGHNSLLGHRNEVIQNSVERWFNELQLSWRKENLVLLRRCSKKSKTEDVAFCTSCSKFYFCSGKSVLISVAIFETPELPQVRFNTKKHLLNIVKYYNFVFRLWYVRIYNNMTITLTLTIFRL